MSPWTFSCSSHTSSQARRRRGRVFQGSISDRFWQPLRLASSGGRISSARFFSALVTARSRTHGQASSGSSGGSCLAWPLRCASALFALADIRMPGAVAPVCRCADGQEFAFGLRRPAGPWWPHAERCDVAVQVKNSLFLPPHQARDKRPSLGALLGNPRERERANPPRRPFFYILGRGSVAQCLRGWGRSSSSLRPGRESSMNLAGL